MDQLVQGAHAIGVNGETFGVAALGNFDVAEPPAVMTTAITRLVAWKLGLSGIDPRAATTLTSAGNERVRGGGADPRLRADLAPGHLVHRLPRSVPLREDGQPAQRHRRADDRDPAGAPPPVPTPAPTGKYAAYDATVLQTGSVGPVVTVLQSALRIAPADGDFGPQTRRRWWPTRPPRSWPRPAS